MIEKKKKKITSSWLVISYAIAVVIVGALLLMMTTTTMPMANAQQQEEDGNNNNTTTVVGSIFNNNDTTTTTPVSTTTPNRAEIIDDQGNVANPGGENPQAAIDAATDDEQQTMSRPTNLQNLIPKSTQMTEFEDFEAALRIQGYAIEDMVYYPAHGSNIPLVIVRGMQGVIQQPDIMTLDETGKLYGYTLVGNTYLDGGQLTIYMGAFNNNGGGGSAHQY